MSFGKLFSSLVGGFFGYLLQFSVNQYYSEFFDRWLQTARSVRQGGYITPEEDPLAGLRELSIIRVAIVAIGFFVGYLFSPWVEKAIAQQNRNFLLFLRRNSKERIIAGLVGLFVGFLCALLVTILPFKSFSFNPGLLNDPVFQLLLYLLSLSVLGPLGMYLGANIFFPERGLTQFEEYNFSLIPAKILDTSVIIDGRVAEVIKSGFVEGTMIVTESVLRELQTIADSSDAIKRGKGRRGLEILRALQENPDVDIQVYDDNYLDTENLSVDERIIKVSKQLKGCVVTNDFNLNRVAMIQKVKVLNINELANAVKPMVIPGESFTVNLLKYGKEPGQGVAYLEDGTMVVVEGGETFIGETKTVAVTSVMQTVAGRLIFAKIVDETEGNKTAHQAADLRSRSHRKQ